MALDPLTDLAPRYDIKGGSPRSPPRGIPVADVVEYSQPMNGNGVWKTLAGAAGGLWIMSLLAWWTAFQNRGVTQQELHEYVKDYWTPEKTIIAAQQSTQDQSLGELKGATNKNSEQIISLGNRLRDDERDLEGMKTKMSTVADMLEKAKK